MTLSIVPQENTPLQTLPVKCAVNLGQRIMDNVPRELLPLQRWVAWKYETTASSDKPTKIPYFQFGRKASSIDPKTWLSFDRAVSLYNAGGFDGVMFVVTKHDEYCGIDIDDCIDGTGIVSQNALRWVASLDSYTEITPSNAGLRVLVKAAKLGDRAKSTALHVEIYEHSRFFTVTGNHFADTPSTINSRQSATDDLYRELFPKIAVHSPQQHTTTPISLDDTELLQKMFDAQNGAAVRALWEGDISGHSDDHSSADLALCNYLAFWTGRDTARMDRLFRQSGLYREKWDRRARGGETYGQGTINRAIAACAAIYTPKPTRAQADTTGIVAHARQALHCADLVDYVDPAYLNAYGNVSGDANVRRVGDALLDIFTERGTLAGYISLRDIRSRAGVGGVETIRRCLKPLFGWFVVVSSGPDEESANVTGGANYYELTFCKNETRSIHAAGLDKGCLIFAKSPFSHLKAHDAFTIGGNRNQRNAALVGVIGREAVNVLIQLEAYDQPRCNALAEYRSAERDIVDRQQRGDAVTDSDHALLLQMADALEYAPLPIELDRLSHVRGYGLGIDALAELGAVLVAGDAVRLSPDYGPVLNGHVQSLGPLALRIISTMVLIGGSMTYEQLMSETSASYGSVTRAMRKLVVRGVCDERRAGMTKEFALHQEWESVIEAERVTMRSNGLYVQREIRDASDEYNYQAKLLRDMPEAAPEVKRLKLQKRQAKALDRLLIAKAMNRPELSAQLRYAEAMNSIDRLTGIAGDQLVQPVAAGGRVVIPANAIAKPNQKTKAERLDLLRGKDCLFADDTAAAVALAADLGVYLKIERTPLAVQ